LTEICSSKLAGGGAGAVAGIGRDWNSTVLLAPYDTNFEVGSSRVTSGYGSLLIDMPPDPRAGYHRFALKAASTFGCKKQNK
jgi:hypothetical protein